MLILPQLIKIKWTTRYKKYYESKGYTYTMMGDEFYVHVLDLPKKSKKLIKYYCDFCNEIILRPNFVRNDIHACKKHRMQKTEFTNMKKYGVKSPLQLKEIQEKSKQTCLKQYGVEKYSQTEEYKRKTKQTCLDKYGVENPMQSKEIKEKMKQISLDKYGVEHPFQSCKIKNKIKQTCLDKYGVENYAQTNEFKENIKQINLKKYGINRLIKEKEKTLRKELKELKFRDNKNVIKRYTGKHYTQTEEYKIKMKKIMLEKYGVEYYFQSEEFKEKFKQTSLKKWGTEHPLQSQEIKDKINNTNIQRYGVGCCLCNPKIRQKSINTMYKNDTAPKTNPQKYIYNLLNNIKECKCNYPIGKYKLDIANLNEMIYVEYDGGGHNYRVKCGWQSQEQFNKDEIKRQYFLKSLNWKLIRIISDKDLIPQDQDIINLIEDAKQYLLNSNHTWYKIDIDKKQVECKEYTKPIELDNLIKITKGVLEKQKEKLNIKNKI